MRQHSVLYQSDQGDNWRCKTFLRSKILRKITVPSLERVGFTWDSLRRMVMIRGICINNRRGPGGSRR